MGVRRAQHIGAQHADLRHVIDVPAGAAQEVRVLLARDRLPNSEFTHGSFPHYRRDRVPMNRIEFRPDIASSPSRPGSALDAW